MASTTTAPSLWTRTGLHSISSRPCSSLRREARRAAAGRSAVPSRAAPLSCRMRALDARGIGGERDDRDVVEHLGVAAAEPDHERGHDRVPPHRDDQLGAGRGHPLHEHRPARAEVAERGADGGLRGAGRSATAPTAALCRISGCEALTATRPPSSPSASTASSSPTTTRPSTTGTRGAEQVLDLVLGEPAAARRGSVGAARGGGHLPQAGRVGRRGLEGGGAGQAGAEAGDRGDARRRRSATAAASSSSSGQGGDDHDRDRARAGAVDDAVLDRLPALSRARRRGPAGGRRRRAPGRRPGPRRRARRCRAPSRGRPRSPRCSRAGWRSWRRRGACSSSAAEVAGANGGQLEAEPLGLVRAEPGVAARAGEDPEPAAARAGAADGERLGELEQVVHVGRPRRAGLARERAEDTLVAGQRAGVRGRGRAAPTADAPTFSTATPIPASAHAASASHSARAVPGVLDQQRDGPHVRLGREVGEPVRRCVTTVSFPDEIAVWSRRPRRVASALTTRLPLWRDEPDVPRLDRVQRVAPQRRPRVERDQPVAVRAADGERVAEGRRARSSASSAAPSAASRAKRGRDGRDAGAPAEPRSAHRPPRRSAPGTVGAGVATTTASGGVGRSASDGKQGKPWADSRRGLTPQTSPPKPRCAG